MNASVSAKRTQESRSAAMRERLVAAAIDSLVERGYARTNSVEICKRAGVTRGAFQHHFTSVDAIFAAALAEIYEQLLTDDPKDPIQNLEEWVDRVWMLIRQPQFKVVIEIWLASANDPDLDPVVLHEIARYKAVFSPQENPSLAKRFGGAKKTVGFYRLAVEAMIGMALGRAVTPGQKPLDHETLVLDQLKALARSL